MKYNVKQDLLRLYKQWSAEHLVVIDSLGSPLHRFALLLEYSGVLHG